MKMSVLDDKDVQVIKPEDMLEKFGCVLSYILKDGILYVNEKTFEEERIKFEKHLTDKEIAEDMYREVRAVERYRPSLFDVLNKAKDTRKFT
jgi:hypothetical protein